MKENPHNVGRTRLDALDRQQEVVLKKSKVCSAFGVWDVGSLYQKCDQLSRPNPPAALVKS